MITFSYKQHPRYNFVLVANRDEFFARPTEHMQRWSDHRHIYAGRDLLQGGTWLGLSSRGKFSAVTNYRNGTQADVDKKSRGDLTLEFLANEQRGYDYMQTLQSNAECYGGFNLLAADVSGLHYMSNTGAGYKLLEKGLYGLSNAHLDTDWPKVRAARVALDKMLVEPQADLYDLSTILQDNTQIADDFLPQTGISLEWERVLSSRFIRTSEYGTRCTTVIVQTYEGETSVLEQSFDPSGKTGECTYVLQLPVFGGARE